MLFRSEKFREYYNIYGWWDNTLYDGIPEMLRELKARGKTVILATSKPEDTARKIIALFELGQYFDFQGGASGDTRDHKWQVLDFALNSVNADRSKAVMIGDRMYDAEGAKICGIDSIAVAWGHGSREELESSGFAHIAQTPEQVLDLLK